MVSGLAAIIYAWLWLIGSPPPGITTIIVLLFVGIGLNSLGIGMLGEYIGRAYAEVKHRPLFIVQETKNIEYPAQSSSPHGFSDKQK
jgi:dolichol-phosphate mannosyltransferase